MKPVGSEMKAKRKRRAVQLAVLLPVLLLVAGSTAWAQKTAGEVRGTVMDTSGAVLPGATVSLTNVNTGYTRDVTTDAKGDFVFPVVDPGRYRVEVTLQSFKKYSREVAVSALETAQIQAKLEVGGLQETVEVTATLEGVNVTSGGVSQKMQKEVLEMPNLNRYGFANATLMPAIQQSEERRETINASVAGNTSNRNAFYIDGAEATDPWRGWSPRQPVVDAFEEIVVNTAGAQVDVGSNFGGTYNAIFKSGTNAFHGSAWYFFRDSSLNANSWVNNRSGLDKPDDPLKYYGGQVGGPIIKDKLFFYVTGSRETDQTPFSQTGLFAPTTAMLNGDFSGLGLGSDFVIYDPDTGQPFPGNVIPASRIDPVSKAFWDKYGYNIPSYGPNYNFQYANERKVNNINARIDYNISQQHRLTLSGYWFKNETMSPDARVQSLSGSPTGGWTGNTFQKGGNELSEFPQTVLNGKWTFTPKSNLVIETRAAYSSMPERVVLAEDSLGTTLGTLGANDPLPRPDAPEILPAIGIGAWWGDSRETAVLFNGWTTDFTVKNLTLGSSATWITGLAQRQGRRRVPGRQLQHDQAGGVRRRRRDGLLRQLHLEEQPRPGRLRGQVRPRHGRLPARPLRELQPGRRVRRDAPVVEPGSLRDGHLAREPAGHHHARPPVRVQQRDQRDRESAHAVPARSPVDDVSELPAGSRGGRRRRASRHPLGLVQQDRASGQLRLRREG